MAGELPNSSIFDSASVCPKERFYVMGKTIDFRTPEGVHEIQLFHDSREQQDVEPFGKIIHTFLDDSSSFFLLSDEQQVSRSGSATLSRMETADILSFTGPDAAGQQLTATFTVTTTRLLNSKKEFYDDISLTQTFRAGELTQFFSGDDHARLIGMYKAAVLIRENKPHYIFTALHNLLTPFIPTVRSIPEQNSPNHVFKR